MKNRSIDTIRITITPDKGLHSNYGATVKNGVEYVHSVRINDEYVWSAGVRIRDFEDMLNAPGDYWPFFCSYCGDPGCADIFYPIRCFHKDDLLVLVIRRPLQDTCIECEKTGQCEIEKNGDSFDCPQRRPHYRAYCVHKEEVRQQLDALKRSSAATLTDII